MRKDPSAMEPRWKRKHQKKPRQRDPLPLVSDVQLKYQMAAEAEIMNWVTPIIKAFSQRYPNREYKNTYCVSLFHFTAVKNTKSDLGPISPTETM